jgi:hypothetical protein
MQVILIKEKSAHFLSLEFFKIHRQANKDRGVRTAIARRMSWRSGRITPRTGISDE